MARSRRIITKVVSGADEHRRRDDDQNEFLPLHEDVFFWMADSAPLTQHHANRIIGKPD